MVAPGGPAGSSSVSVRSSTATRTASAVHSFVTDAQGSGTCASPSVVVVSASTMPTADTFKSGPGRVPDHRRRRPGVEELGRAVLVDVTDEAVVDAVADQLAQARREAARHVERD